MIKDILQQNQPTVYKMIEKLIKKNMFSHAFLLVGDKGTPKKDAALFMAMSLLCSEDNLACETCDTCKRVLGNNYSDLIYLDGKEKSIKKEDILHIQSEFSRTALEKAGIKVYIIDNIENASVSAINSLLKFLEEPSNNTYAFFTCESIAKVLPTIVSRCQIINFKKPNTDDYMKKALSEGASRLDAYIISNIKPEFDISLILEDEYYGVALECCKKFLTDFNDLHEVLYFLQTEIYGEYKNASSNIFIYMMDILCLFFMDTYKEIEFDLGWYSTFLNQYKGFTSLNMVLLLMEARDKFSVNTFNVSLVLDQLFYKLMREVI